MYSKRGNNKWRKTRKCTEGVYYCSFCFGGIHERLRIKSQLQKLRSAKIFLKKGGFAKVWPKYSWMDKDASWMCLTFTYLLSAKLSLPIQQFILNICVSTLLSRSINYLKSSFRIPLEKKTCTIRQVGTSFTIALIE